MRKTLAVALTLTVFALFGCSSNWGSAGLGAVGGAAASAGGYEYNLKKQRERIDNDFNAGRIDKQEYEIRKDQIQRDSVFR